jgi:hypothetical protein
MNFSSQQAIYPYLKLSMIYLLNNRFNYTVFEQFDTVKSSESVPLQFFGLGFPEKFVMLWCSSSFLWLIYKSIHHFCNDQYLVNTRGEAVSTSLYYLSCWKCEWQNWQNCKCNVLKSDMLNSRILAVDASNGDSLRSVWSFQEKNIW